MIFPVTAILLLLPILNSQPLQPLKSLKSRSEYEVRQTGTGPIKALNMTLNQMILLQRGWLSSVDHLLLERRDLMLGNCQIGEVRLLFWKGKTLLLKYYKKKMTLMHYPFLWTISLWHQLYNQLKNDPYRKVLKVTV